MKVTKTLYGKRLGDWLVASTPDLDRDHDRVFPEGIEMQDWKRAGSPLLYGHDYRDPGSLIGNAAESVVSKQDFRIKPKFRVPVSENDPVKVIKETWDSGLLRCASIGFIPIDFSENEQGGKDYHKVSLLEISLVNVPSNPFAARVELALKAFNRTLKSSDEERLAAALAALRDALADTVPVRAGEKPLVHPADAIPERGTVISPQSEGAHIARLLQNPDSYFGRF